jgi:S-adenosylmethionine-diacylglycerol 3-amino-3-carboxypropyl transferase
MGEKTAEMLESAVHHNHPLSARGVLERLFTFWFDSFVYNQIWEDPRVDLKALELTSQSRILTISSGGCNVLNYLIHEPEVIHAVDLNRNHLSLLKLKLAALAHLPSYEDFFLFFGCADNERNRENYYRHLVRHLDAETRHFMEGGNILRRMLLGPRISYFTKNFYDYTQLGFFLRFLHIIARTSRKDLSRLLTATNKKEQEIIYEETIEPLFNHWIVRVGGKLPLAFYSLGIPPQQFRAMQEEMRSGGMIEVYRERVRRLACQFPIDDNYFGWQAFSRKYDRTARRALPDYLKKEFFAVLRAGLERVETHVSTLTAFLRSQPERSLDRFVFLDAQDWMGPAQITALWTEVARVGRPGTRIIFRTAARFSPIEKSLPRDLRKKFIYEEHRSRELFEQDRSAIYGGFHLYVMPG